MNFKKYIQISVGILFILSIILLVLGIVIWKQNVYTGIIYIAIAIIQFLGTILLYPRISRLDDMTEVGNRSVQQNWIVLSVGIAGCALFLAPFFKVDSMAIPIFAFFLCAISAILSAVNIYAAVKKVKARMVV